jgi:hypothetical protein
MHRDKWAREYRERKQEAKALAAMQRDRRMPVQSMFVPLYAIEAWQADKPHVDPCGVSTAVLTTCVHVERKRWDTPRRECRWNDDRTWKRHRREQYKPL